MVRVNGQGPNLCATFLLLQGHVRMFPMPVPTIYRVSEKTLNLVAMSVNGRPPRFGRTADGRPLQRSGDKFGPQPNDDPCGGCSIFGSWEYQSSQCTSYNWGCLIGAGVAGAGGCADPCRECVITRNPARCGCCVACVMGASLGAIIGCCQDWTRVCVSCGGPPP